MFSIMLKADVQGGMLLVSGNHIASDLKPEDSLADAEGAANDQQIT